MATSRKALPDFDDLVELACTDPDRLESLRRMLIEDLIDHAPSDHKQRLKGLQFTIDMERRRAKNPVHCCVRMSQLMFNQIADLRESLLELNSKPAPQRGNQGKILPFLHLKPEDDEAST